MIQLVKFPPRSEWDTLLKRPVERQDDIKTAVKNILATVRNKGDEAIKEYSRLFDGIALERFEVTQEEWLSADTIAIELKNAINAAIKNITTFHKTQPSESKVVETMPGVVCWRKAVAIDKVGLYIPGGTAPLFSTLLMLAVPATIAGCREIIVCTPPDKNGNISPAILYAARQCGIKRIYKIGGAQAIATMAYGTQTVPQVYKILGPGNRYVTCAKQMVQAEGLAIDMPAGPSEVAVLADDTSIPEYVAADLLSQAEHGVDSQVLLVSNSLLTIQLIKDCLKEQLQELPRKDIATQSLANSKAILVNDLDEGIALLNEYAPEHLILACRDDEKVAEKIINAGSVFLGNYSPESAGDYASGTNHTLPTNGYAKAYGGVSLDSFMKYITFQKLSCDGLKNIGKIIETMAIAEGLDAHAKAVTIRIDR